MSREQLEDAIRAFDSLLARPGVPEREYQLLFEEHPIIMETLGYRRWIARPRLPQHGGGFYEPDFLAELPSGIWELVDLKTPEESVVLPKERRSKFTATMSSYVSQLAEYQDYFAEAINREACLDKHGADVQPDPDMKIIAGRDSTIDRLEVHKQSRRLAGHLDVFTFDQIVSALEQAHARQFSGLEGVEGLLFAGLLRFTDQAAPPEQCITDVHDSSGARLSLRLLDSQRLSLSFTSGDGPQTWTVDCAVDEEFHNRWVLIAYEVGSGPEGALLQLRIDDRIVATLRLPLSALQIQMERGTFGAAVDGTNCCVMDASELTFFDKILGFRDRGKLVDWMFAKAEAPTAWIEFSGNQFFRFDPQATGSGDMKADPGRAPTLRKRS